MTRAHKIANLVGVALPLIGIVTAIALLWNRAIGPLELGLMVAFYVITCLGVTLGYHRLFTTGRLNPRAPSARSSPSSAQWPWRAPSSPGWPITASTTHSPIRKAIRIRLT
jgi:hypothetical protein